MANESAAKKRILVVSRDFEYNDVVENLNKDLKNYRLESLPSVLGTAEKIVETQLRKGDYDGFLVDEQYVEFLPRIKQEGKKYGVIRWHDTYDDENLKRIFEENKTIRLGFVKPEKIEKDIDAIFA